MEGPTAAPAASLAGLLRCLPPSLEPTGQKRATGLGWRIERRLTSPVAIAWVTGGLNLAIEVPVNYVTDGFSMPGMLLQAFQPNDPIFLLPAIIHDWLYDLGLVPRKVADLILLFAMREVGVPEWKCRIVYAAVRAGGAGGFDKPLPVNMEIVRQAKAAMLANGAAQLAQLMAVVGQIAGGKNG